MDINLLIDEVLDNYSFYLKEHKIKLINSILEDEVYIDGDYNRLVQVFVNLIKNSVEAIDGEGIIEVISKVKRGNIYISITDNGSGISKDYLQKIKRPFFTTKKDGNGLGVSLSNEIVEAHGGTMEYKSKEGEYTKVIIMLPIIKI